MFYTDDTIEEVRSRNDVVDLIGNYIKLTKMGYKLGDTLLKRHNTIYKFLEILGLKEDIHEETEKGKYLLHFMNTGGFIHNETARAPEKAEQESAKRTSCQAARQLVRHLAGDPRRAERESL